VHEIENLVVNPASPNGARFLLVTTAIVVKDAGAIEELAARDAEIRDRIVDLLSGRTIEELGDPTRREALKTDLAAAIGALFPEGVVKRVLLPQFVIQ
jgi:flagellar FliL protein